MLTTEDLSFYFRNIALPFAAILGIPQLDLQDFASHRIDVFLCIFLGDCGEDQQSFADGGHELAIYGDRGGLDAL